jgi:hypothetical protein
MYMKTDKFEMYETKPLFSLKIISSSLVYSKFSTFVFVKKTSGLIK